MVEEEETYIITTISKHAICAGQELIVNTKQVGTFPPPPDNTIFIQLSNVDGSFERFTNIGSSFNYLNISCIIPSWAESSDKYKIRMRVKSDPPNHYYVYPLSIDVSGSPPNYFIEGKENVCEGTIQTYNINLEQGDAPKWFVNNGTRLDTFPDKATVRWGKEGNGLISVQAKKTMCGPGDIAKLEIIISKDGFCITSSQSALPDQSNLILTTNVRDQQLYLKTNFIIKNTIIYNYTGEVFHRSTHNIINIENLSTGMYLIHVEGTNDERMVKKFNRE